VIPTFPTSISALSRENDLFYPLPPTVLIGGNIEQVIFATYLRKWRGKRGNWIQGWDPYLKAFLSLRKEGR
jgi:hypothetical protein